MSLGRLAYYSAILAGWGAFLTWAFVEFTVYKQLSDSIGALVLATGVGAGIGCGVNIAAGLGRGDAASLGPRALVGLVCGAVGGACGGGVGELGFRLGMPRAIGWMLLGVGIGVIDGLYERSPSKLRNGAIGGALGGLLGGLLFDPLAAFAGSTTGMSSRATALVVLGLAVGACVGLAQVVLKEAWLTVLDGYRPGRQIILSQRVTTLGRAEHVSLAFLGQMNTGIGLEQVTVTRERDGGFWLADHGGGTPVMLNHRPLQGAVRLADGDMIKLGPNAIRFNERRARIEDGSIAQVRSGPAPSPSQPPVPPPPFRQPPPPPPAKTRPIADRGSSSALPKPAAGPLPPPPKGPPPPPPPPKR